MSSFGVCISGVIQQMRDEEKSKKLAKRSLICLAVDFILAFVWFFSYELFGFSVHKVVNKAIALIWLPVYIIGLVLSMTARNTCKECEYARKVSKAYIIITIILAVIIIGILILVAMLCSNLDKCNNDCNGCFESCNNCPG